MVHQQDDTDREYLRLLAAGQDTTAIQAIMDASDADRRQRLAGPGALLEAALWYAQVHACPVFPLQPGTKRPFKGSHGLDDATLDADKIRAWWARTPDANVGIATGYAFDAIDLDGPHATALAYAHPGWWPPIIGKVCTPRPGGNHWLTKPTPGATNKTGMVNVPDCNCAKRCGIDHRALGGYVVAPPSRTPVGTYVWIQPLRTLR